MQTTGNLGLKKPEGTDVVNIDDLNYNADILDQEVNKRVINVNGVPSIQAGLDSAKPAAGTVGRLYVATDTQIIYRDTGTSWQKVGITKWGDMDGKPTAFTPVAHKSTHASGGTDALTPADIGAETPAGAQAKVNAHANASDPHPQYALDTDLNSHTALTSAHGATSAATANTIIMRDASGRAKVAAPSASDDIARKAEVDTKVSKSGDTMTGDLTLSKIAPMLNFKNMDTNYLGQDWRLVNYIGKFEIQKCNGNAWEGSPIIITRSDNVVNFLTTPKVGTNTIWHSGNDGAGSGLDADTLDTKHASDFQNNTKIYGSVTYTDSIAAMSTLTKNIALGGSYKHGMAVVSDNVVGARNAGLVTFGTNNLKTKAVGYYATLDSGSAACREFLGSVTSTAFGLYWTGSEKIRIDELYISGTNLVIVFNNKDTNSRSLNCRIDWEVW